MAAVADVRIEDSTNDIKISFFSVQKISQVETLIIPATASATQADYVLITNNLNGETAAVWLDIDDNGTAPTGALYVASDYQIEVNIASGGTAIANAAAFVAALELEAAFSQYISLTDNLDGTITLAQLNGGVAEVSVPKSSDDAGVGSILVATVTTGSTGELRKAVYLPKSSTMIIHGERDQILYFADDYQCYRTGFALEVPYKDVTVPSSTSLTDLVSQVITIKDS